MAGIDKELLDLEEIESFSDDTNETPPSDIVAYNELRSCADIVRMYEAKQLDIQPDFQRDVVWAKPAQTRFIDSLIKQLPIPSMCISLDYKTEKRLVIDGLQRISSIINFLTDDEWKLSVLGDIDPRISGKTVRSIKTDTQGIFDRVQNLSIPVTVLRCDYSIKSHNEYLFTIFHRLNTGGNKLNNQEIRNCIYNGSFNTLLKELASSNKWKRLLSLKRSGSYRFSNEEIILRFFSLHDNSENYSGKLAQFLNEYMYANKTPSDDFLSGKESLFEQTVDMIYTKISDGKALPKMAKATLEALLIGVAKNLENLTQKSESEIKILYKNFRELPEFSIENLKNGLSARDKVLQRISSAIDTFSK